MLRKPLAALLILSWVVLSGFDLLEDLEFGTGLSAYSGGTDKSVPPYLKHLASLANNIIESAHGEQPSYLSLLGLTVSHSPSHSISSFHRVSELYKLHRAFLI
jgi:hypothetical protein